MLIEPEALLMFAKRSGLTLYRRGGLLLASSKTEIPPLWADTLRLHKAELLPLLNEQPSEPAKKPAARQKGENYDLFGDDPRNHPHRPPAPTPKASLDKHKPKRRKQPVTS